jgi:shikimate dehydrogenase
MRKFGLIGYPLSHSFSQKYFREKFRRENIGDAVYELFPLTGIEQLPSLLQSSPDLTGLNVTIPYKQTVIPFLDKLSDEAKIIGAVNCIKITDGKLIGCNTDAFGFEASLENILIQQPQQTFILGTGGASKAVAYVLKRRNIPFLFVSRTSKTNCITYSQIEQFMQPSNLFINTSPVGMYPDENAEPQIPFEKLGVNDIVFDLIYNPAETLLLKKAKAHGAKTKNGLEMLELQAEKSWQIWNTPDL